jgi:hypothetical protein
MLGTAVCAQIDRISLGSSNQQLIESAVKEGLFVIHQCYQLQDVTSETPKFFGRNEQAYFGDTHSLAVKTSGGYYVSESAVKPWENDLRFLEYKDNAQYSPVVSQTEYRSLDDAQYKPLPFKSSPLSELSEKRFSAVGDDKTFQGKGFLTDNLNGKKDGWLVLAVADKTVADAAKNTPVSLIIYRQELTFEDGKDLYEIKKPSTEKKILGGIYVLPEVTDIGQVSFKLSGMVHLEKTKWNVVKLTGASPVKKTELTPIEPAVPIEPDKIETKPVVPDSIQNNGMN